MSKITVRNIVLIWLSWALLVIGFQSLATARLQPHWPDMLMWSPGEPTEYNWYEQGHPYLLAPFMNNQIWIDSEFYLAISINGYEDPCVLSMHAGIGTGVVPCTDTKYDASVWALGKTMPLTYAFFPFYPIVMHLFAIPLSVLQLGPIATATLAGVIVSALGTLAAMLALYDLTYKKLGDEGAMRAVFYLLIFPTSFFFVQVYTEGLFVGLAFSSLAMLKRTHSASLRGATRHLVYAALLAAAATLTRAVGIMLVIPMIITWVRTQEWYDLDLEWDQLYFTRPSLRPVWHALLAFLPLIVFLVWKFSYYGAAFDYVETHFFGRAPVELGKGFNLWAGAFYDMIAGFLHSHFLRNPHDIVPIEFSADYLIQFVCMAVGFITILACLKTDPEVAWFSLAAFLVALVSGPPGIYRYMLVAPAVFITLARWGRNPVFDRAWTIASLMVMGFLALLVAFDFWVN